MGALLFLFDTVRQHDLCQALLLCIRPLNPLRIAAATALKNWR